MKKLILTGWLALACEDMGQANNWDSSSPYIDSGSFADPDDTGIDTDTGEVDTESDEILEPDTDTTPEPETKPECVYLKKPCVTPPKSRCIDEFTLMDFRFPVGHCISDRCYYSWAKIDCVCVPDDTAGAYCEGEK